MIKKLFILLCLFCIALPSFAITDFDVDKAREEAFKGVLKYEHSYYCKNKFHIEENEEIIHTQEFIGSVGLKKIKAVAIKYKSEPNKFFYYYVTKKGNRLITYDIEYKADGYYKKVAKYTAKGNLLNISLYTTPQEYITFELYDKKTLDLIYYWI